MRTLFCLLLLLASALTTAGQTVIQGVVEDSLTHERMPGASVTLLRNGKPTKFARTDAEGKFSIHIDQVRETDEIQTTMMGYKKQKMRISLGKTTVIRMTSEEFSLREVQVKGSRVFGVQDTITFDLTRFADERDNNLKDVLQKLPGVDVSKSGQVSYNGKAIDRFTVEGLDMTGGRYGNLTEKIKAKDVEKAEIIENDQPIKALRDKVFSDDIALNIGLKDEARDRLMLTVRPYFMLGEPTHVGGSAHALQIVRQRQLMYEAAYDRTGRDLAASNNLLARYSQRLSAASLPDWLAVPALSAPIDEERLRFNTSQKYSMSRIQKDKKEGEWRVMSSYLRSVIRQQTASISTYDMGETTPIETRENKSLLLKNDHFIAEMEHKVNTEKTFGNDYFKVSASQADGLSTLTDTLNQRIRVAEVNIEGSIYRLFSFNRSQLSWRSGVDYHHSASDLYINHARTRIRTNLWHTAHQLTWTLKRPFLTHHLTGSFVLTDLHALNHGTQSEFSFNPHWYYKRGDFAASLSTNATWMRYSQLHKSLFLPNVTLYTTLKSSRRSEWSAHAAFTNGAADMSEFAYDAYQKDYRTYLAGSDFIPRNRQLAVGMAYDYKRPIKELFFHEELNAARTWRNSATDMRITDGCYYYTLQERDNQADFLTAKAAASKGFFYLHLKTKLGVEYIYLRGSQLSDGRLLGYKSHTFNLTPNIEFTPKWGALSYSGELCWQRMKHENNTYGRNSLIPSSLFNWRQQLSLTATVGKVDLTCSLTHYHRQLQNGTSFNTLLADAIAVWRWKRFRTSATVCNLLNQRAYKETFLSGISTSTSTWNLRGRELIIALQYAF